VAGLTAAFLTAAFVATALLRAGSLAGVVGAAGVVIGASGGVAETEGAMVAGGLIFLVTMMMLSG
jgi:hypothetical protein